MNLLEQIKSDRIEAMKEKNEIKKSILSVLVGEIDRNRGAKELTDDVVIASVVKMCKSCEETIAMLPDGSDVSEQKAQLQILSKYRPVLKSVDETREIVTSIIANGANNMGMVMKELKSHAGIDMKIASAITKELLV